MDNVPARQLTWVEAAALIAHNRFKVSPSPGIALDITQAIPINASDCTVTFILQTKPIRESGVTGCQIDHVLMFALESLRILNREVPCRESSIAITKIEEALHRLRDRREDRIDRGVEGTKEA